MADNDELDILTEYEGGTVLKGIRVSDGWVKSPYEVHTNEGISFERDGYRMARALAVLLETYKDIDLTLKNGIPTQVALDGAPAIATYLHGAQERPRSEVAEIMDVSEKTVLKYLNRLDSRRRA